MYLILDIIITFIAYTLVPFALFFKRKDKYEEKRKQTIIICNSIVIAIIFIIIRELLGVENSVQSFMPAFIYYIINSTIWNSKQINLPSKTKRKAKKKKMHVNLKFISTIIIIIFLIASLITNLYFFNVITGLKNSNEQLKNSNKELENNLNIKDNNLNYLLNGNTEYYLKNKLNFFDENIVFVIDGYGNYYSNYDCMIQRVGNNSFTFWAYNTEAAIANGYKEYKCQ